MSHHTEAPGTVSQRHRYVDWLRNLAILYLFPYHTARMFDESSPFYVQGQPNAFSTELVRLSYWFMPLLFFLAGMSSLYALRRRNAHHYARERVLRLLVPLVFGFLVIVPPQSYYALAFHHDQHENYLVFLRRYFTDFSDWSEYGGGIILGHLWFLLFLFVISMALLPVMSRIVERRYVPRWPRHPAALLLVPPLTLAGLALLPDMAGKNPFEYGAYFLLGYLLAANPHVAGVISEQRRLFLTLASLGAAAVIMETHALGGPALSEFWHPLVTWVTLLALLGYARQYLGRETTPRAWANQTAFPVYVLHQTFLVMVGYYVVRYTDHGAAPFLVVLAGSMVLTAAAYGALSRTRPTRFLLGIKTPRTGRS